MRTCPFCAHRIDLLDCDIVSAVQSANRTRGSGEPGNGPQLGGLPAYHDHLESSVESDSRREHAIGDEPVLVSARPERVARPNSWVDEFGLAAGQQPRLVPVEQAAPPEKLPRRRCPECQHLLPPELDELDARILALVGVNNAGKSHYLARALKDATQRRSLRRFGCTEFAPTGAENTANELADYYNRVDRERALLDVNQENDPPKHFIFTVTQKDQRFLLVTHDLAGEAIVQEHVRATKMAFLRRADAVVFLLDPAEFDAVRRHIPDDLLGSRKPADQIDLLRQCLNEVRQTGNTTVPLRVVVTKADLLRDYAGLCGPWLAPPDANWVADVQQISDAVRAMLEGIGEYEVLDLLRDHPRVTFHAVSALGAAPQRGALVAADPVRCEDPLGSALFGITLTAAMG
jgi:hypothetical protein